MCLNLLGMIHLDSHITSDAEFGVETQFTKVGFYLHKNVMIVRLDLNIFFY